jgi:hypothetical protein
MCDGGFFGWMDKMGWVGVEYGASDWGMENVPEPKMQGGLYQNVGRLRFMSWFGCLFLFPAYHCWPFHGLGHVF